MWAIVPIKRFAAAKQRLRDALDGDERAELARAMLEDVLGVLVGLDRLDGVAVVLAEPGAIEIVRRAGARVIAEAENRGQSAAVADAATTLAAEGVATVVVIPGDVPLLNKAEMINLLDSHRGAPALTIVPARDGLGTNGLVCSPPSVIPFGFGEGSLDRHLRAARSANIVPTVVECEGLGLDIDTLADLRALLEAPMTSRAQSFLVNAGIAARIRARPTGAADAPGAGTS